MSQMLTCKVKSTDDSPKSSKTRLVNVSKAAVAGKETLVARASS